VSEDTIIVNVDDSQLDIALAKAKQLIATGTQIPGGPNVLTDSEKLMKEWSSLEKSWSTLVASGETRSTLETLLEADLPSLNRELRVILGQIPGAREAMTVFFRLKRAQMAAREALEAGTILTPSLILTLIATMTLILQAVLRYWGMIQRDKREYEKMVRQYRGWTKEEFDINMKKWEQRSRSMVP